MQYGPENLVGLAAERVCKTEVVLGRNDSFSKMKLSVQEIKVILLILLHKFHCFSDLFPEFFILNCQFIMENFYVANAENIHISVIYRHCYRSLLIDHFIVFLSIWLAQLLREEQRRNSLLSILLFVVTAN